MGTERQTANAIICNLCGLILCCVVAGVAFRQIPFGTASAQSAELMVIKADFKTTTLHKSKDVNPTDVEEGTYFIAPDGRHRIESLNLGTGERIAEIVNFRQNRRIALDLAKKQAVIGSNSNPWSQPSTANRSIPGGLPTGLNTESNMTNLGTKAVAGLVLEGTLNTTTFSGTGRSFVHTMELWVYRFPDPRILPILIERRFEGPNEIEERHVDTVTTIPASPSIFEVPANFTVVQRP